MRKKLYQYKILWLLLAFFMAYILFGFIFAPKIIKQQLTQQLSEQLAMQAEMNEVSFNPLTFAVHVKGLKLTDSNQQTWYASQSTGINLDPINLIWAELNIAELSLVQPKVIVKLDSDGQLITPAMPTFNSTSSNQEPLNITINQIRLNQANLAIEIGDEQKDFSLNIKNIELDHDAISLADHDNHFEVKITTENDESIALNGYYNHVQKILNSDIHVIDWRASALVPFLPNESVVSIESGLIQANGHIDWQLSQKTQLNFSTIDVEGLQGNWNNDFIVEKLYLNLKQITLDVDSQILRVDSIHSDQAAWQINWPLSSTYFTEPQVNSEPSTNSENWKIAIDTIAMTEWPVEWADQQFNTTLPIKIRRLEVLEANNLNQAFTLNSLIELSGESKLQVHSEQTLTPLSVGADIKLEQLSLETVSPWITDLTGLVSIQGMLNTEQRLDWNIDDFVVLGQFNIQDGQLKNQNGQVTANWDDLEIAASSVSSKNKTITFDQITLNQAAGSIKTDTDQSIQIKGDAQSSEGSDWTIKIGQIKTQKK